MSLLLRCPQEEEWLNWIQTLLRGVIMWKDDLFGDAAQRIYILEKVMTIYPPVVSVRVVTLSALQPVAPIHQRYRPFRVICSATMIVNMIWNQASVSGGPAQAEYSLLLVLVHKFTRSLAFRGRECRAVGGWGMCESFGTAAPYPDLFPAGGLNSKSRVISGS
jgi:hypothetical protein